MNKEKEDLVIAYLLESVGHVLRSTEYFDWSAYYSLVYRSFGFQRWLMARLMRELWEDIKKVITFLK